MARTFIASDARSGRRAVIVEVRPELLDGAKASDLELFEQRLYDRHVHAGLIITPDIAHFVRDMFVQLDFSPSSYKVQELPTTTLFRLTHGGRVSPGEGLYDQVKVWLDAVARSWSASVPDEALPMMLPEIVGGLAQARVEEWDDVLDAAE